MAKRTEMLGVCVGRRHLGELIEASLQSVDAARQGSPSPFVFACANPHSLVSARDDHAFMTALRNASAVVADGVGVRLVAQLCAQDVGPRITGSDYFRALMAALHERGGGRVALFGSSTTVLRRMTARIAKDFPRVEVVESISPPYGQWSQTLDEIYIERLAQTRADVVWVGMTAPKQERWVEAVRDRLGCGVIASIGAVFDYYAGTVRRAPPLVCRAGLEWAYRLAHEPSRLWRRNIVSTPVFLTAAMREAWLSPPARVRRLTAETRL